ncbi:hypothetical protein RDABS01_026320 [Bienertia sinuspersici]
MSTSDKNAPRRWTGKEDELLVKLLLDMNFEGKWKVDGGFKSGYLTHLEKFFSEKMPKSGFNASNIDSRLSYLKKKFNALLEIKNKGSGFGWDDNLKMVTGDHKLFEEWSKSHKEAKGMFRKPFPLFDDLEEIYAKDRATGMKSAMPADRDDEDLSHNAIKKSYRSPKNIKVGLREELGRVPGISRENALSLCVKMTEDEIVIFRDLTDDDEKYDFLRRKLEKF